MRRHDSSHSDLTEEKSFTSSEESVTAALIRTFWYLVHELNLKGTLV
jgi:hypothetical protein